MSESANRNGTRGWGGWVVIGVSLGVLIGIAVLKGHADSGGELD
ncbi:MAG TPA: hypothetical protein VF659_21260 [Pyrinomonadaceae bacterium]|jgi:hypothetical protein